MNPFYLPCCVHDVCLTKFYIPFVAKVAGIIHFYNADKPWHPKVMKCNAADGNGIAEVWQSIQDFGVMRVFQTDDVSQLS